MVMPGDNVQMKVDLIAPIAMEEGLRFAIREGGRTVGAGVVANIIEYGLVAWSRSVCLWPIHAVNTSLSARARHPWRATVSDTGIQTGTRCVGAEAGLAYSAVERELGRRFACKE
jgi:hypothetical protein